ncbi:hypothetical protein ACVMIH_004968 [Bradyrhizobium sp. USDA 4503]|uniref:hypothetical protein n=1 Tax=Bradyrhizobium pachyrhizi TaxID=280333 RepID=UPI00070513DE|nr:hypothetical protein [Bradyrhizobium pachyrhizi]KRP90026.1 hypothetical protein AOQ73_25345 [Bradyrhizobium pachyrhizi]
MTDEILARLAAAERRITELELWAGKDVEVAPRPVRVAPTDYSARLAMPKVALREMTGANVPVGDIVGDGRRRSPVQRD